MANRKLKNNTSSKEKQQWRLHMLQLRANLPQWRRDAAEQEGVEALSLFLGAFPCVLSYNSFKHEFNTKSLNRWLGSQKKLILPRVENTALHLYSVTDMSRQLRLNGWGIGEPDPLVCQKIEIQKVGCVLVPGLAFDKRSHRLGYGKGFYDKFLFSLPTEIPVYGLGFKEQLVDQLPTEDHDIRSSGLFLF